MLNGGIAPLWVNGQTKKIAADEGLNAAEAVSLRARQSPWVQGGLNNSLKNNKIFGNPVFADGALRQNFENHLALSEKLP